MPIYYVNERHSDSFYERQLPNEKYRYEGYKDTIKYCIDSRTRKTKQELYNFLDNCSDDYLITREGYIIDID